MNEDLLTETTCGLCNYSCLKELFLPENLNELSSNKSEIVYKQGEVIVKQGSYTSRVLFLKKGVAKTYLHSNNGKSTMLRISGSGSFIALPAFSQNSTYPFTVEALQACHVCQLREDAFLQLVQRNSEAMQKVLVWMGEEYRLLYERLSVITTRNSHGKLASALLSLFKDREENKPLLHSITRRELAEFASISLESANKILLELKNDRIIDIDNKNIKILKPDLIERLSAIG